MRSEDVSRESTGGSLALSMAMLVASAAVALAGMSRGQLSGVTGCGEVETEDGEGERCGCCWWCCWCWVEDLGELFEEVVAVAGAAETREDSQVGMEGWVEEGVAARLREVHDGR